MNRRSLLKASVPLLLAPTLGQAAPAPAGTVVVELINFHCPRCRQINEQIDRLIDAAASVGHTLRTAPVAWQGQSLWPDRVFYAMRDLYPGTEGLVRESLFDGIQRDGLRFEELPQVMAYFERQRLWHLLKAKAENFNPADVAERASSDAVLLSELKAARLLDMSGATEVPVFVWVAPGGSVVRTITPAETPEPAALVQRAFHAITNPSKE